MSDNYYLKLRLGDRVIETGSSCMTWQRGTVVQSSVDPGSLAVKWDTDFDGGKMTTSITHGTMLIGDVVARIRSHDDLIKERDALRAELAEIAKLIHYPDCWCDTAYPTLFDALNEIHGADFECSTCWAKKQNNKGE